MGMVADRFQYHREALDLLVRAEGEYVSEDAICDLLSIILTCTDDAVLKSKCLDAVHELRLGPSAVMSQYAQLSLVRLRGYCEAILARSD
jgi:hypothetical protein